MSVYRCRMSGTTGQYATIKADDFESAAAAYMQTRGMRRRIREGITHCVLRIEQTGRGGKAEYWSWDMGDNKLSFLQRGV